MNLALDIGNSRSKAGIFQGSELVVATELENVEAQLPALISEHSVTSSILASVTDHDKQVEALLLERGELLVLTHETPIPVTNRYTTPETLGHDRLALVVGGRNRYPENNVLVLDAGTALTMDIVTAGGEYLGGAISPGLRMRLQALHNFTGKLPLLEPEFPQDVIGNDTNSSILAGAVLGMIHELEGSIAEYKSRYPDLVVLLTGGDAPFFETRLKSEIFAVPNLVLEGLNNILTHNNEA